MAAMNVVRLLKVRQALAANNAPVRLLAKTKGALIQINFKQPIRILHTVGKNFQTLGGASKVDDGVVRIEDIADVALGSEDYSV